MRNGMRESASVILVTLNIQSNNRWGSRNVFDRVRRIGRFLQNSSLFLFITCRVWIHHWLHIRGLWRFAGLHCFVTFHFSFNIIVFCLLLFPVSSLYFMRLVVKFRLLFSPFILVLALFPPLLPLFSWVLFLSFILYRITSRLVFCIISCLDEDWGTVYFHPSAPLVGIDHEWVTPFCHPEFTGVASVASEKHSIWFKPFGTQTVCLGGEESFHSLLSYAEKFFELSPYLSKRKFLYLDFVHAHDPLGTQFCNFLEL